MCDSNGSRLAKMVFLTFASRNHFEFHDCFTYSNVTRTREMYAIVHIIYVYIVSTFICFVAFIRLISLISMWLVCGYFVFNLLHDLLNGSSIAFNVSA